jgi:hypothetical protein
MYLKKSEKPFRSEEKLAHLILILTGILFLIACGTEIVGGNKSGDSSNNGDNRDNTVITDNSVHNGDGNEALASELCSETFPEGLLWKPAGENSGNLVILFPSEFARQFLAVRVEVAAEREEEEPVDPETETIPVARHEMADSLELESGTFRGYFEDGRQIWDFSRPGEAYTGRIVVDNSTEECEFQIPGDPAERNEG